MSWQIYLLMRLIKIQVDSMIHPAMVDAVDAIEAVRQSPEDHRAEVACLVKDIQTVQFGWCRVSSKRWRRPAQLLLLHAFNILNPNSDYYTFATIVLYFLSAFFTSLQTGNAVLVSYSYLYS